VAGVGISGAWGRRIVPFLPPQKRKGERGKSLRQALLKLLPKTTTKNFLGGGFNVCSQKKDCKYDLGFKWRNNYIRSRLDAELKK